MTVDIHDNISRRLFPDAVAICRRLMHSESPKYLIVRIILVVIGIIDTVLYVINLPVVI